jgi:4-alpha-glucanotransferase
MIPKKSNTLYKELAEEIDVPIELVEDLIQAYYKNLRNELTNLTNPRINVEGLGQFVARPGLVKKSIERYKKALNSHDTSTFRAYYNKKMLEEKVECLESLDKKIEEQEIKKQKFKQDKNEDKFKGDMEEPETDH